MIRRRIATLALLGASVLGTGLVVQLATPRAWTLLDRVGLLLEVTTLGVVPAALHRLLRAPAARRAVIPPLAPEVVARLNSADPLEAWLASPTTDTFDESLERRADADARRVQEQEWRARAVAQLRQHHDAAMTAERARFHENVRSEVLAQRKALHRRRPSATHLERLVRERLIDYAIEEHATARSVHASYGLYIMSSQAPNPAFASRIVEPTISRILIDSRRDRRYG